MHQPEQDSSDHEPNWVNLNTSQVKSHREPTVNNTPRLQKVIGNLRTVRTTIAVPCLPGRLQPTLSSGNPQSTTCCKFRDGQHTRNTHIPLTNLRQTQRNMNSSKINNLQWKISNHCNQTRGYPSPLGSPFFTGYQHQHASTRKRHIKASFASFTFKSTISQFP